jgi:hypothetical protein
MTPNDKGRFCNSCAKTVVDFTNMLPNKIEQYFQKNTNVCGRFKSSQLNSLTIHIPIQTLYNQTQYSKLFLLVLFITMGATLFSCADKNGNKQKIEKVVLVEDSLALQTTTLGLLLPPKISANKNNITTVTNKTQIKFLKPATVNCSDKVTKKPATESNILVIEDEQIYNGGIEFYQNPEYNGGIEKFKEYIYQNYIFPQNSNAMNGSVSATFVVEKEGSLSTFVLKNTIEPKVGAELLRVLERSDKWIPGSQNGKKTRSLYLIILNIKTDTIRKSVSTNRFRPRIESITIKQ